MVFIYNCLRQVRNTVTDVHKIGDYKLKATAFEFCEKTPFGSLLEEAYSYEFKEEPDYDKLQFMMKIILIEHGIKPQKKFTFDIE